MRSRKLVVTLAGAVLVVGIATGAPAEAQASLNVPCSEGSLKAAIVTANGSGGGTLTLAAGCTYVLTGVNNTSANGPNGLPVITTAVTVIGNGAKVQRSGDVSTPGFRIFEVAPSASLTASDLTISNGFISGGRGGAIYNGHSAALALTRVTLSGNDTPVRNSPPSLGLGGAIFNAGGAINLDFALVVDNGDSTEDGGAVENFGGTTDIRNSTFRLNEASTGGAVHNGGVNGTVRVRSSVFVDNQGVDGGGAIDNDGANLLEVTTTSFAHNTAIGSGADIFNGGTIVVSSSSFSGGSATQGGAIFNGGGATITGSSFSAAMAINGGAIRNTTGGQLTVQSSSLASNQASEGGALQNDAHATATISGSFINANTAVPRPNGLLGDGAGAYNSGALTLVSTRVTSNRAAHDGGGVFNAGTVALQAGAAVVTNTPNDCVNRAGGTGC